MINQMKYVVLCNQFCTACPVIFDPGLVHSDVCDRTDVVSAGFVTFHRTADHTYVKCFGESQSLDSESRGGEDEILICGMLNRGYGDRIHVPSTVSAKDQAIDELRKLFDNLKALLAEGGCINIEAAESEFNDICQRLLDSGMTQEDIMKLVPEELCKVDPDDGTFNVRNMFQALGQQLNKINCQVLTTIAQPPPVFEKQSKTWIPKTFKKKKRRR